MREHHYKNSLFIDPDSVASDPNPEETLIRRLDVQKFIHQLFQENTIFGKTKKKSDPVGEDNPTSIRNKNVFLRLIVRGDTYKEIADDIGVTCARVEQIVARTIRRIRQNYAFTHVMLRGKNLTKIAIRPRIWDYSDEEKRDPSTALTPIEQERSIEKHEKINISIFNQGEVTNLLENILERGLINEEDPRIIAKSLNLNPRIVAKIKTELVRLSSLFTSWTNKQTKAPKDQKKTPYSLHNHSTFILSDVLDRILHSNDDFKAISKEFNIQPIVVERINNEFERLQEFVIFIGKMEQKFHDNRIAFNQLDKGDIRFVLSEIFFRSFINQEPDTSIADSLDISTQEISTIIKAFSSYCNQD